jgi:hypothetical protein
MDDEFMAAKFLLTNSLGNTKNRVKFDPAKKGEGYRNLFSVDGEGNGTRMTRIKQIRTKIRTDKMM